MPESTLKELWNNNFVKWILVTIFFIILAILVLSIINSIIVTPLNASITEYITMLSIFVSLLSSMIALSIPFVMKGIDRKEKREEKKQDEKDLMRVIIERIKQYFKYILKKESDAIQPPKSLPFFRYLALKKAEILLKLAIEVDIGIKEDEEYTFIWMLDNYRLTGGSSPLLVSGKKREWDKASLISILKEMIVFTNSIFKMKLDPNIAEF